MKDAIFCWSGGKDSALALHRVIESGSHNIIFLMTTISKEFKRVSMHGIREELLDRQAASLNIPLKKLYLESSSSNDQYDTAMREFLRPWSRRGVDTVVFGDINLADLREYRESRLRELDMTAHFPLWNEPTSRLIGEFIDLGYSSVCCSADEAMNGENLVGETLSGAFLDRLPEGADPCGENGEYHSFAYDGPLFHHEISFKRAEKVRRVFPSSTGALDAKDHVYWYIDLLP
ncbi:MAG: adenine nucleotide alpha hydrolase [Spirochaetota bacterium]|nr:adenine nucleotide alpha hydrolase [Spirochaetota bacterium]